MNGDSLASVVFAKKAYGIAAQRQVLRACNEPCIDRRCAIQRGPPNSSVPGLGDIVAVSAAGIDR